MSRKNDSITLSLSPKQKSQLEVIALQFGQTWGDDSKPNVSKLFRAIADGDLKVVWGDEEIPTTDKQKNAIKSAIAMIQEGLARLIKII